MTALLSDRTAVVTGAASGNGRAIARTCAEEGADVVVADIRREPREEGEPTDELIRTETDREATYVECDVTDLADLTAAVDAAEQFGGIDVMVNNAGIITDTPFFEVDETEVQRLIDVNVKGAFFGSQVAAERMRESGSGSIVNVSSTLGIIGSTSFGLYSATKGAVTLLTYSLGGTLAEFGIRVNAVHPGTIETQMNVEDIDVLSGAESEELLGDVPLQRFGRPGEVADAVAYLASDRASYVNATSLVVDGGEINT